MNENIPQFRVTTPNREFNGKTLGVTFTHGAAYLSGRDIPEWMHRGVEETARLFFLDWQYQVEPLTPEAAALVEEWKATRANAEPAKSGATLRTPKLKRNAITRAEGTYKTEA